MRTHELVKQELLARLGSQWQVDQWLPPVSELAKILSAGHVSTHRALQSLAEEGYLLPLRGKGTKILRAKATSKATSTAAQTIPLGVRPKVAILRTRHTDAMVHRMVDAFIDAAKPMNPDYVFAWQEGKGESPVLNETADVAVLFNPILGDDLKTIWPRVNHVMMVSTGLPEAARYPSRADLITIDQQYAGYLAGNCLREAGCRSVCFLGCSSEPQHYDATSQARLQGFEEAWGNQLDSEHLMYGRFYSPRTGDHALKHWRNLSPRPDAICAASDELALGILAEAVMEGSKPGVDFQLVSIDGQHRARSASGFALTTVQLPADAMGRQAAKLLKQRVVEGETEPMRITLGCQLLTGQTVKSMVGNASSSAHTDTNDSSPAESPASINSAD